MNKEIIKEKLELGLLDVQNPGWYIGGEPNSIEKTAGDLVKICLTFPDSYALGMSHNGTRILYHQVNKEPDLAAERCFAPLPDMGKWLRDHQLPLYSLESKSPLKDFEVIGISLQSELNFTAVPYVLELAQIPAWSADRKESDPLVIGGGPCMANPEPVADFFDAFLIGDGEVKVIQILRLIGECKKIGLSRRQTLEKLGSMPGLYIPSLWKFGQNQWGEWVPAKEFSQGAYERSQGVKRVWIDELNPSDYPTKNPIPNGKLVHNRFSVEVMRGCTQGCRFCQAGYWYRPNRELDPAAVIELTRRGMKGSGDREIGLLSLSTADYSQVNEVTDHFIQDPAFKEINLSLPSLRANEYGQNIAMKAAQLGGGQTATFAPETGSERLRKIINKTISDEDMLKAAEGVFSKGIHTIKLYTMVGLPTENLEDMESFCKLIEGLWKIGQKYHRKNKITVSMGIFIPKPFTPMQWCPFMPFDQVWEHISFVRKRFYKVPTVKVNYAEWDVARLEALYSRGDRSVSKFIYKAYLEGSLIESHSEYLNIHYWNQFFAENQNIESRLYETRAQEDIFPWDFIHAGVSKGYLKSEFKKMFKDDLQPLSDCKWGDCHHCGIPGNYVDIKLANKLEGSQTPDDKRLSSSANTTLLSEVGESIPPSALIPNLVKGKESMEASSHTSVVVEKYNLSIHYQRTGFSRFLPHQVLIDHFEKAFRRLEIPLLFSEGFNPRPILKSAGALPLGMESKWELVIIPIGKLVEIKELHEDLQALLPVGIKLVNLKFQPNSKFPKVKSVLYSLPANQIKSPPTESQNPESLESITDSHLEELKSQFEITQSDFTHKNGTLLPLTQLIKLRKFDQNRFFIELWADSSGNTPNPLPIFKHLFHNPSLVVHIQGVTKEKVELEDALEPEI